MKSSMRLSIVALVALAVFSFSSCTDEDPIVRKTISFQSLELEPESYWDGSDESGGFTIDITTFNNDYNPDWDAWSGFAYSNTTDMETQGWVNQYSAYTASGANADNIYAVSFVSGNASFVSFDIEVNLVSAKFTNSTYSYFALRDGTGFSDAFGSDDWFKLIIIGYDDNDIEKGSVEFYLADFRSGKEDIVDDWTTVNLSTLTGVSKIAFQLESSDVGDWGMNNPAYFCLDDLVFEHMY